MTPRVRLVKCPKCWNVLPESADVPVYKCGGCDAILQAKRRTNDAQDTRPELREVNASAKDESVESSKEKNESSNMGKDIAVHSSEPSNVDGQDASTDEERPKLANGISSSSGFVGEANRAEETNGEVSPVEAQESEEEQKNIDLHEKLEKLQIGVPHNRVMSVETFAGTEYVDPCSEFSGSLVGDSFRSPPALGRHHQVNDADHLHNRDESRGKEHDGNEQQSSGFQQERRQKNKLVSNEMLGMPISVPHGRYGVAYGRNIELPPRVPGPKRAPRFFYGDEGPSNQTGSSFFPPSSGYHPPEPPEEFIEEEKMRLLRIVYELEDQLKKAYSVNRMDGRKSQAAAYYSHELPEEEGPLSWAGNFRSSRRPFSQEASRTARWNDYSQWGHFPRARQRSAPLPQPLFHNASAGGGGGRRGFLGPHSSWPSSPQQYLGSELSMGSSDPSHELQKLRKYYADRDDHILKRHLRPIHRAAPFVACYRCSAVLQLPEDSIIVRRRCHRVRCGACLAVLKFSLENGTWVVPYEPEAHVPPPSEAEDCDDSIDVRELYRYAPEAGGIDEGRHSPLGPRDIDASSNSPLHKLLGYSTVSQVFRGYRRSSTRKSP